MPVIGLRGDAGWHRGDRDEFCVLSDESETDELFVNIDDVDDVDKFVSGGGGA